MLPLFPSFVKYKFVPGVFGGGNISIFFYHLGKIDFLKNLLAQGWEWINATLALKWGVYFRPAVLNVSTSQRILIKVLMQLGVIQNLQKAHHWPSWKKMAYKYWQWAKEEQESRAFSTLLSAREPLGIAESSRTWSRGAPSVCIRLARWVICSLKWMEHKCALVRTQRSPIAVCCRAFKIVQPDTKMCRSHRTFVQFESSGYIMLADVESYYVCWCKGR